MSSQVHHLNPLNLYFSAARDQVARAAPSLILPSCLLPPGHVIADQLPTSTTGTGTCTGTRTPILVYRNETSSGNVVNAFVNRCRHRGAKLIKEQNLSSSSVSTSTSITMSTPLKGFALTCPYHGWTYDVRTGHLKGVPGASQGFPCLDKNDHGLEQLSCVEAAGGIWVGGEQCLDKELWSVQDVDLEVSGLLSTTTNNNNINNHGHDRLVGYREWNLEANWQLLVETFLESYHVQSLHQDTLGLVAHSNVMVTDRLDARSLRMTVPLKNFDNGASNDADNSPMDHPFFSQTTTTYFLFPNTAISLFKRFALFLSIQPNGTTSSRVRAWGVAHGAASSTSPGAEKEDDSYLLQLRDLESVLQGIEEDWECAEDIQRGLNAASSMQGENETAITTPFFTYGRFEGNNVAFLNHVGDVAKELEKT
jgi:phenylpropionate dioxygenase-like ring-hydroxylating dioxygenase large terminal subunit